ncbi:MAG: NHL repeat-containing protein [Coriobacteriia bacterium]|nr:NHL repeat-containing protein [Coriobacteriia bacterium]
MSEDYSQISAPDSGEQQISAAPDENENVIDEKVVSSKGRKILAVALVILVLLLIGIGFLLVKMMLPSAGVSKDTGGVTWIRSLYGFGDKYGELINPNSVVVDPADGTFWMTDPSFIRLVNVRMDGSLVKIIGKKATQKGAFRNPSDMAIGNDGLIYVIESTYDVVRVFDKTGNEKGSFTVPSPLSIAVSDNYIVVGANSGFVIMDKNANVLHLIGTNGKGTDQFDKINGVAIDGADNIYVVDTFNNRISKWTPEGKRLWMVQAGYPGNKQSNGHTKFPTTAKAKLEVPMGCTLDANNHLVVIDLLNFSISQFDTKTGRFVAKYGQFGTEDGNFFYPSDISYDAKTDVFVVADSGAKRAQIVRIPNSGGSVLSNLRSNLSGPLALCCIPILIILICLAIAYFMQRNRKKKEQEKYFEIALEEQAIKE